MPDNYILFVIVPVAIKDELVDTLITLKEITGFSLVEIAGYSREHSHFSQREMVAGYQTQYRFEVMHSQDQQVRLLETLAPLCATAHARYWITPVVEQGHFGS
jgi:hypothetical protein